MVQLLSEPPLPKTRLPMATFAIDTNASLTPLFSFAEQSNYLEARIRLATRRTSKVEMHP